MPSALPRESRSGKVWALVGAWALFAALVVVAYLRVRARGAGQVFTLDDAYISAAIGRHLLQTHTWGVSPGSFSSASSSILWPLLLAGGFGVAGVSMAVPFALNVLFGMGLLWVGWRVLAREVPRAPGWFVLAALCVAAVVTPLPMMVFVGMEHVGFALASLVFLVAAGRALARTHEDGGLDAQELMWLGVAAAVACSLRYEGMFQAAIVGGLFLLRRRWVAVGAVATGAALPIVSFGVFAMRHGAHFFPNSLLQKVGAPSRLLRAVVVFIPNQGLLSQFSLRTGLFALWAAIVWLLGTEWLSMRRGEEKLSWPVRYALLIWVSTVVLHCQFSHLNWLWRYESYLMGTGSLFLFAAIAQVIAARRGGAPLTAGVVALCVVTAMMPRAWNSFTDIPHTAYAIYEQQYQTGMFLARFYHGQAVALNDIGVPSFVSDASILDLVGLGSTEVTNLQLAHRYGTASIAELAKREQSRIAILYKKWAYGAYAPPREWTEVGSWTIRPMDQRVPIADPTFTFFAVTPSEVEYLHDSLCANAAYVPADEIQAMTVPCAPFVVGTASGDALRAPREAASPR